MGKVLRSYRISHEMDLLVAQEIARRLGNRVRASQAEIVEEFFMLGIGGDTPESASTLTVAKKKPKKPAGAEAKASFGVTEDEEPRHEPLRGFLKRERKD